MKMTWSKPQIETIEKEKLQKKIAASACSRYIILDPCRVSYIDSTFPGSGIM